MPAKDRGWGGARRGRPPGREAVGRAQRRLLHLVAVGVLGGQLVLGVGVQRVSGFSPAPGAPAVLVVWHADALTLRPGGPVSPWSRASWPEQARVWAWAGPGRVRQRLGASSRRTCSQATPPAPVRLKATGGKGVGRGPACPCARRASPITRSTLQHSRGAHPFQRGRGPGEGLEELETLAGGSLSSDCHFLASVCPEGRTEP